MEPYGYPLEAHTVETGDGYLLGVFRMPHGMAAKDAPATHRRGIVASYIPAKRLRVSWPAFLVSNRGPHFAGCSHLHVCCRRL